MDDDDYYPPSSVKLRIYYLLSSDKDCVLCTTIGCFHINKYISIINVPPYTLPFEKRVSEATMAFKKSFWKQKQFSNCSSEEANYFLNNRYKQCIEISWDGIIVSLLHSSNTSGRITVANKPNGCHFGFSDELFLFLTNLDTQNNINIDEL